MNDTRGQSSRPSRRLRAKAAGVGVWAGFVTYSLVGLAVGGMADAFLIFLGKSNWLQTRPSTGVTVGTWAVAGLIFAGSIYAGRTAARAYLRKRHAEPGPHLSRGKWTLITGSLAAPMALAVLTWWLTTSWELGFVVAVGAGPAGIILISLVYGVVTLRRETRR